MNLCALTGDTRVTTGARYMSQFTISWKNLSRPARIGKAMNPAYRMWKACSAGRAETKEAREKREPASGPVSRARAMRCLSRKGKESVRAKNTRGHQRRHRAL